MGFRRKLALWICPELGRAPGPVPPTETKVGAEMNTKSLLDMAEAYAAHRGQSLSTVATYAAGDGKFFKRLRGGSSCTLRKADMVVRWFSRNWPDDLAWPSSIRRPQPDKKEAA